MSSRSIDIDFAGIITRTIGGPTASPPAGGDEWDIVSFLTGERYIASDEVGVGSDTGNDGTVDQPFATMQAAYDDLKADAEATFNPGAGETLFIGTLYPFPGSHDVAGGLDLDPLRPCRISSPIHAAPMHWDRSGPAPDPYDINRHSAQSMLYSSSASITGLINMDGSSTPGGGFIFEYLALFADDDTQTSAAGLIYARDISHVTLRNMNMQASSGGPSGSYQVNADGACDNWHIKRCRGQGVEPLNVGSSGDKRGWTIDHWFSFGHKQDAMVLRNAKNWTISGFNTEGNGSTTLILGSGTEYCTIIDVHGEHFSWDKEYIRVQAGAHRNVILGGQGWMSGFAGSGSGVYIRFDSGTEGNIIIHPALVDGAAGSNTRKYGSVDNGNNTRISLQGTL